MNHRYRVIIPKPVQKELDNLPDTVYDRVIASARKLEVNPHPSGCLKLTGRDAWRVKVGDFRIIYKIDDKERAVVLLRVGHRREIYR